MFFIGENSLLFIRHPEIIYYSSKNDNNTSRYLIIRIPFITLDLDVKVVCLLEILIIDFK